MSRSLQITDAGPIAQLPLLSAAATVFQQRATFAKLGAPSLAAILAVPGTSRLEKKMFVVRNSGVFFNAGAAGTVIFTLYSGTDTVVANNTVLAQTPASNAGAAAFVPFMVETRLMVDSTSGTLIGDISGIVGNTAIPKTPLTTTLTGLSSANEPVLNLVFGITPSVANTGNYAILDTFGLED